jgi:hypothetical protein
MRFAGVSNNDLHDTNFGQNLFILKLRLVVAAYIAYLEEWCSITFKTIQVFKFYLPIDEVFRMKKALEVTFSSS